MLSDFDLRMKLLNETAVICENEEKIRNLCSDIIAVAGQDNRYEALCRCRKKLRKLENEKCRKAVECEMKLLDIGKLIENLSLCSDILLSGSGKSVLCTAERQNVSCSPRIIIDAFLNLISNSAKFGSGKEINVSAFSSGENTVIIVENSGKINFNARLCGGIAAAQNAAKLHCGRLLYAASDEKVGAYFSIRRSDSFSGKYDIPDFSAFLSDEFSPVHIGLADTDIE